MNLSTDPYDSVAWQDDVRRFADEFISADDAIKAANEELKPYRLAKKNAKQRLEELMARHRYPAVNFEERQESLELTTRKAKKQPTEEVIRERCTMYCKSSSDAERLAEFVLNRALEKTIEVVPVLRRKKMRGAAAADSEAEDEE